MHAILSSEACNLLTSSSVQTISLSSLHLPWLSANFVIHSYNSTEKEQKKISCISVYRYLSNHYSFINCRFLFSCAVNSWIFLSNQVSIYFLVGFQWCDITHLFQVDPSPDNETICCLRGSWPRLKVSCTNQQNPTLLPLWATTRIAQATVSLEAVWGDARTKFLHLEISVTSSNTLDLSLRRPTNS